MAAHTGTSRPQLWHRFGELYLPDAEVQQIRNKEQEHIVYRCATLMAPERFHIL